MKEESAQVAEDRKEKPEPSENQGERQVKLRRCGRAFYYVDDESMLAE